MSAKKETGLVLTPLLGQKGNRYELDVPNVHSSMPTISFLPTRSSTKNLQGLERESTENASISLHQVPKLQLFLPTS